MHQKEQEMSSICKILKLANGETVIGNVTTETVSFIDVEMPFKIILIAHPDQSRVSLSVIKWDPTFEYSVPVRIYKNSIVACAEPTNDIHRNYVDLVESIRAGEINENGVSEKEKSDDELLTELEEAMTNLLKRSKTSTLH